MSLMKCPECGNEVSDKAGKCPQCGYPINLADNSNKSYNKPHKKIALIIVCVIAAVLLLIAGIIYYLIQNTCIFGHNWEEATCTNAKTCLDCSETEGEPLGHAWTEATCKAPKTCSVCGETEGEPLSHTTRQGYCTNCGEYINELQDIYDYLAETLDNALELMDESINTMSLTTSYYDTTYVAKANELNYELADMLNEAADIGYEYGEFYDVAKNISFGAATLYLFDDLTDETAFGSYEFESRMARGLGDCAMYLSEAGVALKDLNK